jgi:predicted nucleotide-binding protein
MIGTAAEIPLPKYQQDEQPRYHHTNNKNIFIVHGRDDLSKVSLSNFLRRLKLNPIILHEQPNRGLTIIEKFEQNANLAKYAFVLLTLRSRGGLSQTPWL